MDFIPPPVAVPESPTAGTLSASISIVREPVGCEPYVAFEYDVSLRVFGIALTLAKLEGKLNKTAKPQKNYPQNAQALKQYCAEGSDGKTPDGDKSLAGRKKTKGKKR
jgi:hypothetical protein